jgi:hypothetical protein
MKTLISFILVASIVGCVTPTQVHNNRVQLISKQTGCAPVDVELEFASESQYEKPWYASCKDEKFVCNGSVEGGLIKEFQVTCKRVK